MKWHFMMALVYCIGVPYVMKNTKSYNHISRKIPVLLCFMILPAVSRDRLPQCNEIDPNYIQEIENDKQYIYSGEYDFNGLSKTLEDLEMNTLQRYLEFNIKCQ